MVAGVPKRVGLDQLLRYSRQSILPEIGERGQDMLSRASAAIFGIGGLGSQAALSLAAQGVGELHIVDHDIVSITDLHRQLIYSEADLGYAKVEAAASRLSAMNPDVEVYPYCNYVDPAVATEVVKKCDIVLECTDNFLTKYTVNRACATERRRLVYGAALGQYGNVSLFYPWQEPCIECLFPSYDDSSLESCATTGVRSELVQTVGAIQSTEAVNALLDSPKLLNSLLFVDFSNYSLEKVAIFANPKCPRIENRPLASSDSTYIELCSRNGYPFLMVKVRKPTTVEDAIKSAEQRGHAARLLGKMVMQTEAYGCRCSYTAGGILFIETGPQQLSARKSIDTLVGDCVEIISP